MLSRKMWSLPPSTDTSDIHLHMEELLWKTNWKLAGLNSLIGEFYQSYKEKLITIHLKLFQKIEEECILLSSLYNDTIMQ